MRGEVRALRVKATDTVNQISYTVFTDKGRYQIPNLPPSSYSVADCRGGVRRRRPRPLTVTAGAAQTVEPRAQAQAGHRAGRRARRAPRRSRTTAPSERTADGTADRAPRLRRAVSAEPGPRRHGEGMLHVPRPDRLARQRAAQRSRSGGARSTACSTSTAASPGMAPECRRPPTIACPRSRWSSIVKYLTANFGPGIQAARPEDRSARQGRGGAQPGDLRAVRGAAADARRVQADWHVRRSADPIAALGLGQRRRPGVVYMSGNRSGSIVAVDTRSST